MALLPSPPTTTVIPNHFGDPRTVEVTEIDPKVKCCFCGRSEVNPAEWGTMLKLDDIVAHYFCLMFSAGLEQKGEDMEGIFAFMPVDIRKEYNRGKKLKCKLCKRSGATIGCAVPRCRMSYHYPCGYERHHQFHFHDNFASYCLNHKTRQEIPAGVCRECPICMTQLDDKDFEDAVWPPCCGKQVFHRTCMLRAAKAAGTHFFKCPLCNSKEPVFIQAMQANGVFIPEQDAEWETVPNAYQELLTHYSNCDAEVCRCPDGRQYFSAIDDQSADSKWRLIRCHYCASSATHIQCMETKTQKWKCEDCTTLFKTPDRRKAVGEQPHNSGLERDDDEDDSSSLHDSSLDSDSSSESESEAGEQEQVVDLNCSVTDIEIPTGDGTLELRNNTLVTVSIDPVTVQIENQLLEIFGFGTFRDKVEATDSVAAAIDETFGKIPLQEPEPVLASDLRSTLPAEPEPMPIFQLALPEQEQEFERSPIIKARLDHHQIEFKVTSPAHFTPSKQPRKPPTQLSSQKSTPTPTGNKSLATSITSTPEPLTLPLLPARSKSRSRLLSPRVSTKRQTPRKNLLENFGGTPNNIRTSQWALEKSLLLPLISDLQLTSVVPPQSPIIVSSEIVLAPLSLSSLFVKSPSKQPQSAVPLFTESESMLPENAAMVVPEFVESILVKIPLRPLPPSAFRSARKSLVFSETISTSDTPPENVKEVAVPTAETTMDSASSPPQQSAVVFDLPSSPSPIKARRRSPLRKHVMVPSASATKAVPSPLPCSKSPSKPPATSTPRKTLKGSFGSPGNVSTPEPRPLSPTLFYSKHRSKPPVPSGDLLAGRKELVPPVISGGFVTPRKDVVTVYEDISPKNAARVAPTPPATHGFNALTKLNGSSEKPRRRSTAVTGMQGSVKNKNLADLLHLDDSDEDDDIAELHPDIVVDKVVVSGKKDSRSAAFRALVKGGRFRSKSCATVMTTLMQPRQRVGSVPARKRSAKPEVICLDLDDDDGVTILSNENLGEESKYNKRRRF